MIEYAKRILNMSVVLMLDDLLAYEIIGSGEKGSRRALPVVSLGEETDFCGITLNIRRDKLRKDRITASRLRTFSQGS